MRCLRQLQATSTITTPRKELNGMTSLNRSTMNSFGTNMNGYHPKDTRESRHMALGCFGMMAFNQPCRTWRSWQRWPRKRIAWQVQHLVYFLYLSGIWVWPRKKWIEQGKAWSRFRSSSIPLEWPRLCWLSGEIWGRRSLRPARDVKGEALGSLLYSQRKQDTDHLSEKSSNQRKETIWKLKT